jgi:hypothetical protein
LALAAVRVDTDEVLEFLEGVSPSVYEITSPVRLTARSEPDAVETTCLF